MIEEIDTAPTTPATAITFPNRNTDSKNNTTSDPLLLPELRETPQLNLRILPTTPPRDPLASVSLPCHPAVSPPTYSAMIPVLDTASLFLDEGSPPP